MKTITRDTSILQANPSYEYPPPKIPEHLLEGGRLLRGRLQPANRLLPRLLRDQQLGPQRLHLRHRRRPSLSPACTQTLRLLQT